MVEDATMSEPTDSLIVEFVGSPGVGKTTISRALSERLRQDGAWVGEPTFDLAQLPGRMGFRQLRFAIPFSFRYPILTLRWMSLAIAGWQTTVRILLTTSLNQLYCCALVRQSGRRSGVHIFDQGVLQSISSMLYCSRRSLNQSALASATHRSYARNVNVVAVFVHAAPEVVMQRLRRRPGNITRYERIDSPELFARTVSNLILAAEEVERLAELLEGRLGQRFKVIVLSNESEQSIDSVADELYSHLVKLGCIHG